MRTLFLGLVLACLAPACVVADPPPAHPVVGAWERLGVRTVNGGNDHDIIHVGRAEGRFRKIQIVVDHSAIEMFEVLVVFGDGSVYSAPTRLVFGPNTTTRVIDLPGGARVIKRVEFHYGNLPGGGRAQVELWGA
jgi:hypothetical protein